MNECDMFVGRPLGPVDMVRVLTCAYVCVCTMYVCTCVCDCVCVHDSYELYGTCARKDLIGDESV